MSGDSSERFVLLNHLADEFAERYRRGERPALQAYIDRHPELADDIREFFPAMVEMEQVKEDREEVTEPPTSDPLPTLERLGDYRIVREIGRGGMGVVYEAEQESLGRRVALKVLPAGALIDPLQVHRFEREAKAAARLHHTNIVPVFGVGQQDRYHYYVMQFIAGPGLDLVLEDLKRLRHFKAGRDVSAAPEPEARDRHDSTAPSRLTCTAADVARSLITGRFAQNGSAPGGATATEPFDAALATTPSLDDNQYKSRVDSSVLLRGSSQLSALSDSDRRFYQSVARIGVQVAEALAYANRQGILHRDIKPSNLLLDNRGNVWVTDFGLAKTDGADDLTHTGDILGTIRYMAPERFLGKCDVRSDVYSLGLTLYELVALRPAYLAADRHSLMERVLHEEPARLKKLAPMVPRDLETIIAKAITRDPSARYATAAELAEDLQRFVEDRPIRARRAGLAERAWRWCRRNQALAGLMAALAALLIVVTVGSTLAAVQFRGLNRSLVGMNRSLESNLYFSDVDRAHHECLADDPGRAERLLDACPTYLRGWEWHLLKRQSHTAILTLRGHTDYVFNVAFSPDGKTLASSSEDGTAKIWDATTGRLIHDLRGHSPDLCWRVAYSPDGTMLASGGRDKTVKIWDAASGRLIRTLRGHEDTVYTVAFSPVGHLLVSGGEYSTKLWDTKTWREIRSLPRGWHVAFSPDGRRLATVARDLKIWDTATLAAGTGPVEPISIVDDFFWRLAFSPDSRSLITAERAVAHVVTVLDAETGRRIRPPMTGHSAAIDDVACSPDGRYIASASQDGTIKVWDAKVGALLHTFRGHTDCVNGVAFDPTGRRLASASLDGTVKLWDTTKLGELAAPETRTLVNPSGLVLGVTHSSDGRFFATVGGSEMLGDIPERVEAVTVWDAKTYQENRTVRNPTAVVCHAVALDPRFERIAWATSVGTVEIRDATTSHLIHRLSAHTDVVWLVAYSPDGRRLATASRDGTVRIWDAATGHMIHALRGFSPPRGFNRVIDCLMFSTDGQRLALAGQKPDQLHPAEVRLWDAASGAQLPALGGYFTGLGSMAFQPRGGRVACAVGSEIRILEMASGCEIICLRGHGNQIGGLAFSPDGLRLASAGKNGTVKLWEAATGREILTLLHGRGDSLNGLSISPDGWQIISVGKGGTIKVWDATPLPESSKM